MKYLPLILAAILGALAVAPHTSCKTNEAGQTVPDWAAWQNELAMAGDTIARAKLAFPEKAELLDRLEDARQDALLGVNILATGGSPENAADYLKAAANIAAALTEDEDVRFAAFALGEIVARVEFYAAQQHAANP